MTSYPEPVLTQAGKLVDIFLHQINGRCITPFITIPGDHKAKMMQWEIKVSWDSKNCHIDKSGMDAAKDMSQAIDVDGLSKIYDEVGSTEDFDIENLLSLSKSVDVIINRIVKEGSIIKVLVPKAMLFDTKVMIDYLEYKNVEIIRVNPISAKNGKDELVELFNPTNKIMILDIQHYAEFHQQSLTCELEKYEDTKGSLNKDENPGFDWVMFIRKQFMTKIIDPSAGCLLVKKEDDQK